jgi:hypothetical protein
MIFVKALRIVTALFFVVLTASAGFAGCADAIDEPSASDFNMIFKYGVGAKNELNTFEGTFTRDMIMDPSITIDLVLSGEELDIIMQKMVEIDFVGYPDNFSVEVPPGEATGEMIPYPSYYFKVEYGSQVKELRWDDKIINESEKAGRLRDLIDLIIGIIESKREYQELPAPKGGYM